MKRPFLVGICGGSASGKSTFVRELFQALPKDTVALLSQDNYYFEREKQPIDQNHVANFDTPGSIDNMSLLKDLAVLISGHSVLRREYTFNNPLLIGKEITCKPAPIILIDGIFIFHFTELAALFDLKIFIDASEHIRFQRRIVRDKAERGYGLEDVLYHYTRHTVPAYKEFIEPYKSTADIIVPNEETFSNAIKVITAYLKDIY